MMRAILRLLAALAVLSLFGSGCIFLHPILTPGATYTGFVRDISADGSVVLLTSPVPHVANDTNGLNDLYTYDLVTNTFTLVSQSSAGTPGNLLTVNGKLSDSGKVVTFETEATNLDGFDANGAVSDVFVRDIGTGTTTRITNGNGFSRSADISGDGEWIVFASQASNLTVGDTNGYVDIFTYDVSTGAMFLVSVSSTGIQANDNVYAPTIDGVGSVVVYETDANNLIPSDTNGARDIFATFNTGVTGRVSSAVGGVPGDADSFGGRVSGDGQHVVFYGDSTNLVPGDTNGTTDVFVKSLTGAIERVSVTTGGAQASGPSRMAEISNDGDVVVFSTTADELNGTVPAGDDVWIAFDRSTGTSEITSTDILGTQTGDIDVALNVRPAVSGDGRYVVIRDEVGTRPTTDPTRSWVRFRANPTITGVDQPAVPNGVFAPITIYGSGFINDASVSTNLVSPGSDGVTFTNVVVVNDKTITADVEVFGAPLGVRQINVVIEGNLGPNSGSAAFCPGCFEVVP